MKRCLFLPAIVLIWIWATISIRVEAQTITLPYDLVFTVQINDSPFARLIKLDSQTLDSVLFYMDQRPNTAISPIKWSPNGKLLAVLHSESSGFSYHTLPTWTYRLCLIDRHGAMVTCMKDEPALAYDQIQALTWSRDSSKIYFASIDKEDQSLNLIEADIQTEQTQRTLFKAVRGVNQLVWHPLLDYMLQARHENIQVTSMLLNYLRLDNASHVIQELNLLNQVTTSNFFENICPEISPTGIYFAITIKSESVPRLLLFDRQGQIVEHFTKSIPVDLRIDSCPSWRIDDQGFYLRAYSENTPANHIFYYDLSNKQLNVFYQRVPKHSEQVINPAYGSSVGRLVVSPDGHFVAATSLEPTPNGGLTSVVVYTPNGERLVFGNSFTSASEPLWVPPLDE